MKPTIARGQIWWVERPDDKRRPGLVLTRDCSIPLLNDVLVAPLTTTIRGLPTEVLLTSADGVPRDSVIDLQHIMTVPRSYLRTRLATVPASRWHEVCEAMRIAIGC